MKLDLSEKTLDQVYAHAREEFPDECCGMVLVDENGDEFLRKCTNIQNELHAEDPEKYPRDAATAYQIDPKELLQIQREADSQNLVVKVLYHSHPNHPAYFSEKDKNDAVVWEEPIYPEAIYLVVSIYGEKIKDLRAFGWHQHNKNFIEVEIKNKMRSIKVRLIFPTKQVTEPVLCNMVRQFDVLINVRRANVTEKSGWVMLEISGTSEELKLATDYLKALDIHVEPIEGDIIQ